MNAPWQPDDYVVVGEAWIGPVRDIISLTTSGNYTKVSTMEGSWTVRSTSKALEKKLPQAMFQRASRTQIINLGHVKSIRRHDKRRFIIHLEDDEHIIMSGGESVAFRRARNL
jgi:DNA-binding LytR/AlgR family response regulator